MTGAERAPLRVLGRYALYDEIAAGGMATVHVGRLLGPVGFARTVAIKRLHPHFAKDPEFVSMFLDEARLAARVQHPNVVATIDVVATDGELFLIMDYIRGETLSRLLRVANREHTKMPPRIVASICCGFLRGLHAAHEAKDELGAPLNLIHRDVSPQNVLVGVDGVARVLDFGIAKAAGRLHVTRDGQIKGKLAYMPPEQLAGREITRGADVYAAAVVAWEALTGERLFKGETERETLAKVLTGDVQAPSACVPGLTTAFDTVLLRALSRDAALRHATARELAFELEACAGVASTSEVGDWVESMAGAALAARQGEVAEIESHSSHLHAMIDTPPRGRGIPETSSNADAVIERQTVRVPASALDETSKGDSLDADRGLSRSRTALLAVGILLFGVVLGLAVAYGRKADEHVALTPSNAPGVQSATTPAALITAPTVATAAPSAPSATPSVAPPPPRAAPQKASEPPKAVVRTPLPSAQTDCNPPFAIDASGRKKYKLECL